MFQSLERVVGKKKEKMKKEKKRVRVHVWRRKKQGKKGNYMDKKIIIREK